MTALLDGSTLRGLFGWAPHLSLAARLDGRPPVAGATMTERQARPAFMEVDLRSEQGLALLRAVSDRFGEGITRAASLAQRMFMLRSPWAPALRFMGAETVPQEIGEDMAPAVYSLSGSGERLEDAFVGCVGEGIDRLAQIARPGDIQSVGPLPKVADNVPQTIAEAVAKDLAAQGLPPTTDLAWMSGHLLGPTREPARGVLVPADWTVRRATADPRLRPRTELSVGVAAGPTSEWAVMRAILELIERDAAALWWMGGRPGKQLPLDGAAMREAVRLMEFLRQQTQSRASWLLDITTDLGIPVVAALSCNHRGRQLAYGLAARLTLKEAAHAAILELCQTELAIQLAEIKRAESGQDSLAPSDLAHLERDAAIDASHCDLLHPRGISTTRDQAAGEEPLDVLAKAMSISGIETSLINMTRPQFGIPVMRAIAPGLQPLPSQIVTERLKRARNDYGGGERHTGGLALIG
ncbi:YcaO-like family protein [Bradyrhizobium jicamae]|uniref:YcaO-like family protein n=1 Tax=Bradyrhizobium jicamae TaxID=280332 RepID=A0ABS5FM80_9BRAD|nr:YcaO-like family protein [Bradyrhizobium jicamae]MBR0797917.1 YcaO-like family protein [Bradyrhizobium jicamae]